MADLFHFIQSIGDKVFNEAGLVAFLLFWLNIYQLIDARSLRRRNENLHNKIYELGTASVQQNVEHNHLLSKVSDLLSFLVFKHKESHDETHGKD